MIGTPENTLTRAFGGSSASSGLTWSVMRSAADLDTPNNGASCRSVRFVRQ
ncbi:hypothetical protein P3T39_004416 [Kitasatospora sp. GP82]|nr:hypothetical protein [Kitasatospora sp. GP82]